MNGAVDLYAKMWRTAVNGTFIEGVPYCPQLDEYSCARASLAMVAAYYDILPLEECVRKIQVTDAGLTPKQIAEAGSKLGMKPVMAPHYVKDRTINKLLELVDRHIPVIVDFGDPASECESHSAVLVGYNHTELFFHDPFIRPYFPRARHKFPKMWDRESRGYVYFEMPEWMQEFRSLTKGGKRENSSSR